MKSRLISIMILLSSITFAQGRQWADAFKILGANGKEYSSGMIKDIQDLGIERKINHYGKKNLKFGLEILRVKDDVKEIISQKYDYPLPDIKKELEESGLIDSTDVDIYAGLFSIPINTLSTKAEFVSSMPDELKESFYSQGLLIIPGKFENNSYSVRLCFMTGIKIYGTAYITLFRNQDIQLKVGEKIKIDIDPAKIGKQISIDANNKSSKPALKGMFGIFNSSSSDDKGWSLYPSVNGHNFKFTSDDEFFRGIKDYLILSLESDK
jgi:hypothetical protein